MKSKYFVEINRDIFKRKSEVHVGFMSAKGQESFVFARTPENKVIRIEGSNGIQYGDNEPFLSVEDPEILQSIENYFIGNANDQVNTLKIQLATVEGNEKQLNERIKFLERLTYHILPEGGLK